MISAHETCISSHDFRLVAGFGKREVGERADGSKVVGSSAQAITPHDINRLTQVTTTIYGQDVQRLTLADSRLH